MPMKSDREYRNMRLEIREREEGDPEDGRLMVTGYATTFDDPYILFEDDEIIYREQISADAFKDTDMSDVIMQYDHEGRVFARISNKTLDVRSDEKGLLINANLGGTELGRQLYEEIRGGYTDKMSFGFTVESDEVTRTKEDGRESILRTVKAVRKLYDVSAVSLPANDATSISVRNLYNGVIEEIKAERLAAAELELTKRRMLIKAKYLGGMK